MSIPPEPQADALRNLTERADALERSSVRPAAAHAEGKAADQAYKLIAELLGGVLVGLGLGFLVDRLTGVTAPWGLIGGVLAGFAVSIWMAKRTADRLVAQHNREHGGAPAPSVPFDDEDAD